MAGPLPAATLVCYPGAKPHVIIEADRTPQLVDLAPDFHEHLVQVPAPLAAAAHGLPARGRDRQRK